MGKFKIYSTEDRLKHLMVLFFSRSNVSLLCNFIPVVNFDIFGNAILQTIFLVISISHNICGSDWLVVLHFVVDGNRLQ